MSICNRYTFCSQASEGLGNRFSDYFMARIMARLAGAAFAVSNRCEFTYFGSFLPFKVPAPGDRDPNDYWPAPPMRVGARLLRLMTRSHISETRQALHGSPHSPYLFKWFGQAIHWDINYALRKYWQVEQMKRQNFPPKSTENDVVVHVRCGDILTGKYGQFGYSFPCHHFYRRAITLGLGDDPTKRDVWFLVNTNRRQDAVYAHHCQDLSSQIVNFMQQYLGPRMGKSHIIVNGTVSEDMARISQAKLFIGSISSFALWGALANGRNVALPMSKFFFRGNHMPIHGIAWIDMGGVLMPRFNETANHVVLDKVGECS